MAIYIGLAVGLIVAGLLITLLAGNAKVPVLVQIFWWVGIILAVFGLILVLAPILNWIATQVRQMIGS